MSKPRIVQHMGREHRVVEERDDGMVLEDVHTGHRAEVARETPGNAGGEQPMPGSGPGPVMDSASEDARLANEAARDPNYDPYTSGVGPKADDSGEGATEEHTEGYDALKERAEALGVKVDRRWGEDRLRQEVEAAEASQQE